MKDVLPERFYRLLYFCPRPEDDEKVCVGIVIRDRRTAFLEYDTKLEKAHCFAPDYGKDSLSFLMRAIQDAAERAAFEGNLVEFSPQFQFSSPRVLWQPVDEKVRDLLRRKYLLRPRSPRRKEKERGVERRIDQFLIKDLRLPRALIRRKATVDEFIGFEASRDLPEDLIPKPVSRALVGSSRICLIDGVDLHLRSPDLLVERVNRVAHTFWQYKQVKDSFPTLGLKQMLRAAIVFDGDKSQVDASLKWRAEYAFHQLEKDADITVKAGSASQEQELLNKLSDLVGET